jgi:hypothetical protein
MLHICLNLRKSEKPWAWTKREDRIYFHLIAAIQPDCFDSGVFSEKTALQNAEFPRIYSRALTVEELQNAEWKNPIGTNEIEVSTYPVSDKNPLTFWQLNGFEKILNSNSCRENDSQSVLLYRPSGSWKGLRKFSTQIRVVRTIRSQFCFTGPVALSSGGGERRWGGPRIYDTQFHSIFSGK